jgi:RNA polymerase sigma factor (sigma-70 family)
MEVSPNFTDKAFRDYELVQQAQGGDQKAFAELLGHYRDSIYFMLLKMVKNQNDAEDLTIEAFGKAFKNIKFYAPNFAFSTWLFKIATNNAIDFIRSNKVMRKNISIDINSDDSETSLPINLISNSPDPEERLISKQKEKLLRTIVKKLHPDYRQIIVMRYFDELSYQEIAKKLNLPLGTVKARLFRSRELLSSTMKDQEIGIDKI